MEISESQWRALHSAWQLIDWLEKTCHEKLRKATLAVQVDEFQAAILRTQDCRVRLGEIIEAARKDLDVQHNMAMQGIDRIVEGGIPPEA